jgi:hypothetical protein
MLLVLGRSRVQILAQSMAVKKGILRDISKFLNLNVTPERAITSRLLSFSGATAQIGPRHLIAMFLDHTQLGLL